MNRAEGAEAPNLKCEPYRGAEAPLFHKLKTSPMYSHKKQIGIGPGGRSRMTCSIQVEMFFYGCPNRSVIACVLASHA